MKPPQYRRVTVRILESRLQLLHVGLQAVPMLESVGGRFNNIIFVEEEEYREWTVQAHEEVFTALLSIPKGKNQLRRVRFR